MSGEGVLPARVSVDTGEEVLADVIAWLERRRDNAGLIAARAPEFEPWAKDRAQQLEVIIGDLRAGMHVGCALVRSVLMTSGEEKPA